MKKHLYLFLILLQLIWCDGFIAAAPDKPPLTIEEAVEQVKGITHPEALVQSQMRAKAAREIVEARVGRFNDGTGYALQILPVDKVWRSRGESVKERAERIIAERNKGDGDSALLAWKIKIGACEEHSELIKRILSGAGEKVVLMRSSAGHVFPVVNAANDFDSDLPSTWGDNAFVPDSWLRETLTPKEAWKEKWIFNNGNAFVGANLKGHGLTTRERLTYILSKGPAYLKRPNIWQEYSSIMRQLPPEMRDSFRMPDGSRPPDPGEAIPPSLISKARDKDAAKPDKEDKQFSEEQELLARVSEINGIENDMERTKLGLEALEAAKALLMQKAGSEDMIMVIDEKIQSLKVKKKALDAEKEKIESTLSELKLSRYDGYGSDLDFELFLLSRRLLRLKAQIENTTRFEHDPMAFPAERTEDIQLKLEQLVTLYKKAVNKGLKIEGLRAMLAAGRYNKTVRGLISSEDVENIIKDTRSLLDEAWKLLGELRNIYVKNLRDKVDALKELIDLDGGIKSGEPLVPAKSVVPSALLEDTDKMIVWLELNKAEYYTGEIVTGTIWVKNGQPPYSLEGKMSFGNGYSPGSILSKAVKLTVAPALAAGQKSMSQTISISVADSLWHTLETNTVEFMIIAAPPSLTATTETTEKPKKPKAPQKDSIEPSEVSFTRLELFYQDIAETNKVVLDYSGGAFTTLTGVIKNPRGKPIYFDSMDPPVEGYILVDRIKIKGPGYAITSYLDKSGNVSGNFYFPIVGGTHDYELAWQVNGIEYRKVITIEADTANHELDNIKNYEANISNLINELAEYKPGDYGWNSNWGQIAYVYTKLAEAHMFRGDVEKTYEAIQIGTSLGAIEGRMKFFALLAFMDYLELRYLACFIGTDEIFGYMENASGVDYNFLYDNDLFPYVVTGSRTKGEDIEHSRDASFSNLHRIKAYILMEKIGDYAGAKEEWEEYVDICRRNGWKFDEMPVSWSRHNK